MKKVIFSLIIISAAFLLGSCKKTSYDDSKVSYFINFTLNGDENTLVEIGTGYTEEGVVAMEGDTDISSTVKISGDTVDPNKVGIYQVKYSAVNVDGFASDITRTVYVYDPSITTDVTGTYTLQDGTHRNDNNKGIITHYSGFIVKIKQLLPGIFEIDDLFGRYYSERAGYGAKYNTVGKFSLNSDNSISFLSSNLTPWGDPFDGFNSSSYDPETKTISISANYAGYTFNLILK